MSDWPMKGTGSCACKYERNEDFGEAVLTEQCGYHARQSEQIATLTARLSESEQQRDEAVSKLHEMNRLCEYNEKVVLDACNRWEQCERERDEAVAYASRLRSTFEPLFRILRDWEPDYSSAEDRRLIVLAKDAWRAKAPVALSELKQRIRKEAMEEAEELMESQHTWISSAAASAAIRRLAEQEKQG